MPGETIPVHVDLGAINREFPLRSGTVLGRGEEMFKADDVIPAVSKVRTIRAWGGNVSLSEVAGAIVAPNDSDAPEPALLSLLRMPGQQSGAVTGVQTPAPVDGQISLADLEIPLDALSRLNINAKLPDLARYAVNNMESEFEAAILLAGAHLPPQGPVPLGLSAGIDEDGNGKVDNVLEPSRDGVVPLRFASRHSGLEAGELVTVALASSLSTFTGGDETERPAVQSGLIEIPGPGKSRIELRFRTGCRNGQQVA